MISEPDSISCLWQAHTAISRLAPQPTPVTCELVREECERVKHHFEGPGSLPNPASPELIALFLTQIRIMADSIHSLNHPAFLPAEVQQLLQLAEVDLLQAYILAGGAGKPSPAAILPVGYPGATYPQLSAGCARQLARLQQLCLPRDLQEALSQFFQKAAEGRENLTRAQLDCLLALNRHLDETIDGAGPEQLERVVARLLVALDFNHIRFLSWYQEHIYARLGSKSGANCRLNGILELMEEVRQITLKVSAPCYSCTPSVKSFISRLLDEEFRYAVISCMVQPPGLQKLAVHLSVAEIACLVRLFNNAGVFRLENTSEILRLAVAGLRSKRQGDFSLGNLSKEYYGVNQSTAAAVRALLQQLLAAVNKGFFPVIAATGLLHCWL